VTVLDHKALDRARKAAGLLPSQLARALQRSPDAVSALSKPRTEDRDVTLADLRALANALGVSPQQLLTDYAPDPPTCELIAPLVALLYRDGVVSIDDLATRLATSPDGLLDAVDAHNHVPRGLKILRWQDHIGLVADPALTLPHRTAAPTPSESILIDLLLWSVIDRRLADNPEPEDLERLDRMATMGLVTHDDGSWRPTDEVIHELELLNWDTLDLIAFTRQSHAAAGRQLS
jgi:transcriptional regulator with XRE-family HTH domain